MNDDETRVGGKALLETEKYGHAIILVVLDKAPRELMQRNVPYAVVRLIDESRRLQRENQSRAFPIETNLIIMEAPKLIG